MKIKQVITLILICVIGIVSTSVSAKTYEHFTYTIDNNEVTITGYDSTYANNLIIPSIIEGNKVTTIGSFAFDGCSGLTGNLVIPDSVTTIGMNAFSNCTGLTGDLIIPNGVTTIKYGTFDNCSGLTGKLVIPDSVTTIERYAFSNCSGLTGDLLIPAGVTTIGASAFYNCSSLTGNLVIPDSVTTIDGASFCNCSGLTGNLVIPDSVTTIGGSAFYNCSSLTGDLIIPNGVTTIESGTFEYCSGLTGKLVIPDSVTTIGSGAFLKCSGLTGNLVIPDSVTTIGAASFYKCSGLTGNLIIPEGVTTIGGWAFYKCSGLIGNLIIPEGVTTIGTSVFWGCKNITAYIFKGNAPEIYSDTFSKDMLVKYKYGNLGFDSDVFNGIKVKAYDVEISDNGITSVQGPLNYEYTFEEIKPNIKIKVGNYTYIEGEDYEVSYYNNINIGKATAIIIGKGDLKGTKEISFNIVEKNIKEVEVENISQQIYNSKAITPDIKVTYNGYNLERDKDYTVSYKNNINAGTATVVVTGIGSFTGTKTVNFKILNNISKATVTGVVAKTYTGSKQTQKITVKYGKTTLKLGTDYTISYKNNINAGTATLTITGKGKYVNTKEVTFKINRRSITALTFSKVNNYTYTGKAITPNLTVKNGKIALVKGTDYKLTYSKNINKGTATVTVTGLGNYTGTKKFTYKINQRKISTVTVSGIVSKTYTGKAITQSYKLTYNGKALVKGTDFTIKYTNNIKVGIATITFTGKGNYTGTLKKTFKIVAKSIVDFEFSKISDKTYTGTAIKPGVVVKDGTRTLKSGTDYTISYKNNIKVGTATITITGKGNYTGKKVITFNIKARDINGLKVTGIKNKSYTGKAIKQSIKVTYNNITLKAGTDYTVSYENNIEVGTATIIITGKGNYSGSKKVTFKINYP